MKVYLAGPMTGIPYFNAPAFMAAAAKLRREGHEVFNPAEADMDHYGPDVLWGNETGDTLQAALDGFKLRETFAADLEYICLKAEAIALLPGWQASRGANIERTVAIHLGLAVLEL